MGEKPGILALGLSATAWALLYLREMTDRWLLPFLVFAAMYLGLTIRLMVVCRCGEEEKKPKPNG